MPRHRPRGPEVVTAVVGACLGLYGLLTTLVASAWGPGNSDELVSGGLELIPWYGLSCGGTVAAVLGLWLMKRPRPARWALLVAAVSLASWTVFAYTRGDTSAIASPVMSEPFVINVADARALHFDGSGTYVPFGDPTDRFPDFGINIHMLDPGEPNAMFHAEANQECFLELAGECKAILDGEERTLRQWDFLHCPAGTKHVLVGAGSGPCWILMVGARRPDAKIHYPVNEKAAEHGASVTEPTEDARKAYAGWSSEFETTKLPWPPA